MESVVTLAYVGLAMLLGGVVGIERELADKPAGLRTHMLVAGASALLVSLGNAIIVFFAVDPDLIRSDPIRIVEAVITGVSFLGAGTILRRREPGEVEGLTTAASLLFVAVIGICVGLAEIALAVGATVFALVTLSVIKFFEQWLDTLRRHRQGEEPE